MSSASVWISDSEIRISENFFVACTIRLFIRQMLTWLTDASLSFSFTRGNHTPAQRRSSSIRVLPVSVTKSKIKRRAARAARFANERRRATEASTDVRSLILSAQLLIISPPKRDESQLKSIKKHFIRTRERRWVKCDHVRKKKTKSNRRWSESEKKLSYDCWEKRYARDFSSLSGCLIYFRSNKSELSVDCDCLVEELRISEFSLHVKDVEESFVLDFERQIYRGGSSWLLSADAFDRNIEDSIVA